MDLVCGLMWIISGLLFASVFFIIGIVQYRKWKAMKDTQTSMIVDIEPGRVEINGKIEPIPGGLLYSPLKNTPCVQFEAQVQEYRKSKNSHYWAAIHTNRRGGPFIVKDESGKVVVNPGKQKMEMKETYHSNESGFDGLEPRARDYVEWTGVRKKGIFGVFNRRLRVIENIVPVGEHLYVLGDAVDDPAFKQFQTDLITSPFTIVKKGMMVISYKTEEEISGTKKVIWVVMFIIGGVLAFFGLWGFALFFL